MGRERDPHVEEIAALAEGDPPEPLTDGELAETAMVCLRAAIARADRYRAALEEARGAIDNLPHAHSCSYYGEFADLGCSCPRNRALLNIDAALAPPAPSDRQEQES